MSELSVEPDTAHLITPDTIRTTSLYPLATLEERTAGTARVLVTRYWPRGLKRERVALWEPLAAPYPALLYDYRHGALDWSQFAERYVGVMSGRLDFLRQTLARLIATQGEPGQYDRPLTLLCVEHCPRDGHDERDIRCHRRLLRELLVGNI